MSTTSGNTPAIDEERVALPCPYCGGEIYRPLRWFRQAYATCPGCGGGLAAGQFETVVSELERAFEESVKERVEGSPGCGGCGGHRRD